MLMCDIKHTFQSLVHRTISRYNWKMRKLNSTSLKSVVPLIETVEPDTFERIARILICLSKGAVSVTEIAKECDMKVPTVHRLLKSLTKPRFTMYDSVNHRYFLGPLIAKLSSNASTNHQYLRMCSLAEMEHLSSKCDETIALHVLIGSQIIPIRSFESEHALNVNEMTDLKDKLGLLPLGAMQKMLLSQLEDKNLKNLLSSINTKSQANLDVDAIFSEIAQIREHGYVITSGERIHGAVCISCPVLNYFHPAALSIIGPKTRLARKVPGFLQLLKESAANISETLLELRE
jgi:DNA-binding IclR family transcriptional regulator